MHFQLVDEERPICLPRRATDSSAGYDFYAPYDLRIPAHGYIKVPTGITIQPDDGDASDWLFLIFPRSSTAIKHGITIVNTVGVVDADYCGFEIFVFLRNESDADVMIRGGDRFCQGIFTKYLITSDDDACGMRIGGFGSTGA